MPSPLVLAVPIASDLGKLALAVRHEVFVREQHVPPALEQDANDEIATHLVALVDGDVVGALRILFLVEHAKFGRVSVLPAARGQGVATALMRAGMSLARDRGETRFYLTSQSDKLPLYEKLGFMAFGEEFEEGGMPHRAMKTY